MNDQMLPVHLTRFAPASARRMISTISPRFEGRKPVDAVKLRARAQFVKVSGEV